MFFPGESFLMVFEEGPFVGEGNFIGLTINGYDCFFH